MPTPRTNVANFRRAVTDWAARHRGKVETKWINATKRLSRHIIVAVALPDREIEEWGLDAEEAWEEMILRLRDEA